MGQSYSQQSFENVANPNGVFGEDTKLKFREKLKAGCIWGMTATIQ
jgi:hypothetical protein